jgi:hypothetical protein
LDKPTNFFRKVNTKSIYTESNEHFCSSKNVTKSQNIFSYAVFVEGATEDKIVCQTVRSKIPQRAMKLQAADASSDGATPVDLDNEEDPLKPAGELNVEPSDEVPGPTELPASRGE